METCTRTQSKVLTPASKQQQQWICVFLGPPHSSICRMFWTVPPCHVRGAVPSVRQKEKRMCDKINKIFEQWLSNALKILAQKKLCSGRSDPPPATPVDVASREHEAPNLIFTVSFIRASNWLTVLRWLSGWPLTRTPLADPRPEFGKDGANDGFIGNIFIIHLPSLWLWQLAGWHDQWIWIY